MQAYQDPESSANIDDWAFSLAFAQDQARYAFPVAPPEMQPCKNVDCDNKSFAVFCSEACRVSYEGDDTEDYYRDDQSNVTLGHRTTADQQWEQDQAAGGFAAIVCGVQPQVAPVAVQALPESPCSVNTYVTLAGRQVQVTLRGVDEAEVLSRLETLLARFSVELPTTSRSTPVETEEGWCAIHTTQMRWNPGKGGESGWWSHKAADGSGWCKGRTKGQRAA